MRSTVTKLRGFAIVSAIFILVVLATLGAFIVNISTSQQIGSALDVQGVRAYLAARAGIEWGLYQQLPEQRDNPPTYAACAAAFGISRTATFSFPIEAATLQGFWVTVTCVPTPDLLNGGPTVYTIRSTACNSAGGCPSAAPGNLYVERRLEVSF
jgi:MSHA biogenesis protein MshP